MNAPGDRLSPAVKFFFISDSTKPQFFRYIIKHCRLERRNIKQILQKYLTGHLRQEEATVVDNWYDAFEQETPVQLTDTERETTRQQIWEKIVPDLVVEKKQWRIPMYAKVASWAAIAIGAVLLLFMLKNNLWRSSQASAFTIVTTKNGERKTVTIADGSRLTLNAGTILHVHNDFSHTRTIDLVDGEVFFDVHRDEKRPFQVHSSGLTVTVLGTSFNISSYAGLKKFSAGVVSGTVRVQKDTATLNILHKSQQLIYDKEQHTYATTVIDESLLAWRDGKVILNDVLFSEMAVLMKKNFGIDVFADDSRILNTKYTTELFTSMTPDEAMEVLAAIHNLSIKKVNNSFYLDQK
jgi:transmembrane sensor